MRKTKLVKHSSKFAYALEAFDLNFAYAVLRFIQPQSKTKMRGNVSANQIIMTRVTPI